MAAEINTSYIESHLLQALELAKRGYGYVSPNPLVGCVIANEGNVVSTGWHAAYGGPHAEASALQQLSPSLPRTNLTLYVTLEPCNHQGKQPPCTHAILNSGISSVVIGMHDPNPNVSGRGAEFLRAHGLTVVMASNAIANACRWLNRSWSYAVTHNRPYVIAKVAQSSDGYMAPSNHSTLRLTGNETQKVVHELRSQVDAVLVGMGTVRADDPKLTVRDVVGRNPKRIVVGNKTDLPPNSFIASTPTTPTFFIEHDTSLPDGLIGLYHEHSIQSILCEAGPTVTNALLTLDLVNELRVHTSAHPLGNGLSWNGVPSNWLLVKEEQRGSALLATYMPSLP